MNILLYRKAKKKHVVARLNAEAEYKAMAHGTCEALWLQSLLNDIGIFMKIQRFMKKPNTLKWTFISLGRKNDL